MASTQDQCLTLDYNPSTCIDISQLSDTLPSISIDDTQSQTEHDFLLKEHYDQIEHLRKENFDLKMKLYLLESNEKLTSESDLKHNILMEFDKKNNEIQNLKEILKKKEYELKALSNNDTKQTLQIKEENKKLKLKLAECWNLVSFSDQTDMDESRKNLRNEWLKKVKQLLNGKLAPGEINTDKEILDKLAVGKKIGAQINQATQTHQETTSDKQVICVNFSNLKPSEVQLKQKPMKEDCIQQFLDLINNLKALISDFRSNRINYKTFLVKLDSVFDEIAKQSQFINDLHLSQLENDMKSQSICDKLANEMAIKKQLHSLLVGKLKEMDQMIVKVKADLNAVPL